MARHSCRTASWVLVGVLGMLLGATPARAELESTLVRDGIAAYDALDYPRAVALLERARAERLTIEELAATLRTLGAAHVALGQDDRARADFRALLEVSPDEHLDRTVSPRIRGVFDEARASMPAKAAKPAPAVIAPAITPAVDLRAAPPKPRPVYKRAWFWGVIGGVTGAAILAGVLGGVLSHRDGTVVVIPQR